jgi:hypothetical protein
VTQSRTPKPHNEINFSSSLFLTQNSYLLSDDDNDDDDEDNVKVKLSLGLIKHHARKMHEGVEILLHRFLTSTSDGS